MQRLARMLARGLRLELQLELASLPAMEDSDFEWEGVAYRAARDSRAIRRRQPACRTPAAWTPAAWTPAACSLMVSPCSWRVEVRGQRTL